MHADLNVDETTVNKVTYAKKGTPLTQETGDESLKSKGGGAAALPSGTSANTTPSYAGTAAGGSKSQSQYTHKTGTTTYGVDKTIQRSVVAPGKINKIDLALVVDKSVPAAQVASLKKSVAGMAGITPARGDTFAVSHDRVREAAEARGRARARSTTSWATPWAWPATSRIGLGSVVFLFFMYPRDQAPRERSLRARAHLAARDRERRPHGRPARVGRLVGADRE